MPGPEPDILLQKEHFLCINKPVGWTVQRDDNAPSVLAWIEQQGLGKGLPVHRLDKPTSGLLLVARSSEASSLLSVQFQNRTTEKTYLALSDRKPAKKQGWVKGDMALSRRSQWKLLRTQDNPAMTQFRSFALTPGMRGFELWPKTGKTHQLRVAMRALGAPILGDALYGGTASDRLYLHAWRLSFDWDTERLCLQCDPDDRLFQPLVQQVRESD